MSGYGGDVWHLNGQDHIYETVKVLDGALKKWGVEKLLNFVRGGRKAFEDGV